MSSSRFGAGLPGDPWSSPWNPGGGATPPGVEKPVIHRPAAPKKPRNPVPRISDLFAMQDNLIRGLKAIRAFEASGNNDEAEFKRIRREVREAYKKINAYLNLYG